MLYFFSLKGVKPTLSISEPPSCQLCECTPHHTYAHLQMASVLLSASTCLGQRHAVLISLCVTRNLLVPAVIHSVPCQGFDTRQLKGKAESRVKWRGFRVKKEGTGYKGVRVGVMRIKIINSYIEILIKCISYTQNEHKRTWNLVVWKQMQRILPWMILETRLCFGCTKIGQW